MLRTDVRIAGTEPDADQRQLATSCAVVFLASASLFIYIPELAPLLLHDASGQLLPPSASTQMRQQLYALAMSVPQLCSAVGAPILGAVSDYWGRKRSLMLAITGVMLAMLLCAVSIVSHHTTLFIAGLATIGLMDGSGVIVQAGLVEGRTAEAQAADIGKLTTWSILGIICGPLVGGLFSDNRVLPFASSVVPFLLTAALFGATLGIIGLFYRERQTIRAAEPRRQSWLRAFARTAMIGQVRWYLLQFFLMEIVLACFYERIPLLLQQRGDTASTIGLYAAYIGLLMALACAFLVPRIPTDWTPQRPLTLAFSLLMATSALLLGEPTWLRTWGAAIPFALGSATIYCLTMAKMAESVQANEQGKIAGLATFVSGLAFLVAGLVVSNTPASSSNEFCAFVAAVAATGIVIVSRNGKSIRR